MSLINKFIKDNNLTFSNGNRNTPLLPLVGFSLYKGITLKELTDCLDEIADKETIKESERLYNYGKNRNYGEFFKKETTKQTYVYD